MIGSFEDAEDPNVMKVDYDDDQDQQESEDSDAEDSDDGPELFNDDYVESLREVDFPLDFELESPSQNSMTKVSGINRRLHKNDDVIDIITNVVNHSSRGHGQKCSCLISLLSDSVKCEDIAHTAVTVHTNLSQSKLVSISLKFRTRL